MDEELAVTPTSGASPRSVDPTARIQIYFQGILDGACFLYAPANAYKALTGKRVTREHWNRAMRRVPDAAAFLGGPGATEMHHDEAQQLMERVFREFQDPDEAFAIERLGPTAEFTALCQQISTNSVVIFAYRGATEFQSPEAHVVCGVAATRGPTAVLHLACSTAFWGRYLKVGEYHERHHPHLERWSNDSISAEQPVTIAPNFRWRITLSPSTSSTVVDSRPPWPGRS